MAAPIALIDASVLHSSALRDVLIQLATTELFRARWSDDIHDEWIRSVLRRPDINATLEKLGRTRDKMNEAVPDSLVTGYRDLIPKLELPDPDDRHVLAAAIVAGANVIVTFNLRDFPPENLEQYGIEAQHPDEFVARLIDLDRTIVRQAMQTVRARLKKPPFTNEEYLTLLAERGMNQTVRLLRDDPDSN